MQRLLIIGKTWPEPNSSAAGARMMQIIQTFIAAGVWELTFASTAQLSPFAEDLEQLGIRCQKLTLNDSSMDKIFRNLAPDVVIFDRFMVEEQFGWRIARTCPDAIRILDTEDLHFLREARCRGFKNNQSAEAFLYNNITAREIASIVRSDLSLMISQVEMRLLKTRFKIEEHQLLYLPFLINRLSQDTYSGFPDYKERRDFVFIGNFKHEPNYDAVLYLKEIWPRIKRALPDAKLKIYGAYTSQKVQQLENIKDGFEIKGRAQEVGDIMRQARVLLAPLRFGAGLKGKFFDAMQNGVPSVTTSIGAEGIADTKNFPGFMADSADDIIDDAVRLYSQESLWESKRNKAFEVINNHFCKDDYQAIFLNKIMVLQTHLEVFRRQNFWQQMLMQHRLQSTKYLSRWIETKTLLNEKK